MCPRPDVMFIVVIVIKIFLSIGDSLRTPVTSPLSSTPEGITTSDCVSPSRTFFHAFTQRATLKTVLFSVTDYHRCPLTCFISLNNKFLCLFVIA